MRRASPAAPVVALTDARRLITRPRSARRWALRSFRKPFPERRLALARGLACQQALDADVFVEIIPVPAQASATVVRLRQRALQKLNRRSKMARNSAGMRAACVGSSPGRAGLNRRTWRHGSAPPVLDQSATTMRKTVGLGAGRGTLASSLGPETRDSLKGPACSRAPRGIYFLTSLCLIISSLINIGIGDQAQHARHIHGRLDGDHGLKDRVMCGLTNSVHPPRGEAAREARRHRGG